MLRDSRVISHAYVSTDLKSTSILTVCTKNILKFFCSGLSSYDLNNNKYNSEFCKGSAKTSYFNQIKWMSTSIACIVFAMKTIIDIFNLSV